MLVEKSRRHPNLKNRTSPEIKQAIIEFAYEQPTYGQVRVSNEIRKKGMHISVSGVRWVWPRNGLETFKKRLAALEKKVAEEEIVLIDAQVVAFGKRRHDEEASGELETAHPGYLDSQDTLYVGTIRA